MDGFLITDILIILMFIVIGKGYSYVFYEYIDPILCLSVKFKKNTAFKVGVIITAIAFLIIIVPVSTLVYETIPLLTYILVALLFCILLTVKFLWDS